MYMIFKCLIAIYLTILIVLSVLPKKIAFNILDKYSEFNTDWIKSKSLRKTTNFILSIFTIPISLFFLHIFLFRAFGLMVLICVIGFMIDKDLAPFVLTVIFLALFVRKK